jgi:DNA-binding MarR family transcriptional regulator
MSDKRDNVRGRRAAAAGDPCAQALYQTLRKISAELVLVSDGTARHVGLHPTDLQCVSVLELLGPTTASMLAGRIGLTTGAMTAVIDRLEAAGFVRRERPARDRRRVLVHAIPARMKAVAALYRPLRRRLAAISASFSDEDLATVLAHLQKTLEACAQHVNRLQARSRRRPAKGRRVGDRRQPAAARRFERSRQRGRRGVHGESERGNASDGAGGRARRDGDRR